MSFWMQILVAEVDESESADRPAREKNCVGLAVYHALEHQNRSCVHFFSGPFSRHLLNTPTIILQFIPL